jgi:phosphatidylserine decarboxylase
MHRIKAKRHEIRQALAIHGGVLKLCTAALAVRLSRVPIPSKRLRLRVYRTIYGKKYAALDEQELEQPLWAYRSFNALFTRGVRSELRPIAKDPDTWLCPCDGRLQDIGTIQQGRLLTVKGIAYDFRALLAQGPSDGRVGQALKPDLRPYEGGLFAIVFLSPADCHRVFSPQDGQIEAITHVPGYRMLVHPPYQTREFPVLSMNERVIIRLGTAQGSCMLVLVAGWGVGNITLPRLPHFMPRPRRLVHWGLQPPLPVHRGEWIATFELGSTAVLIMESSAQWVPCVERDDRVRYGQPLFSQRFAGPRT